jgi:hypothetical protein
MIGVQGVCCRSARSLHHKLPADGYWFGYDVVPGGGNQHGFQKPPKGGQIGGSVAITSGDVWLILSPAPMLRRKISTTAALQYRARKPHTRLRYFGPVR